MKLPSRDLLAHPDHHFLYDHDIHELHNCRRNDSGRLTYESRYQLVLDVVQTLAHGHVVLDVGCAQGNFSLGLAERGFAVVAMDIRQTFLEYLRFKYEAGRLCCVAATLEAFPFRLRAFDVILLTEVLEHLAYPEKVLRDLVDLLVPGGILVLTTPNGSRLHTGLPTLAQVRDRRALELRQFQADAEGHLFLLTRGELGRIVREAGLKVIGRGFFCSPWISGRLRIRHISWLLPLRVRRFLDQLCVRVPLVRASVSEGLFLVAQRS